MSIIKKPIITEKYTALGEKENKFGFIVDRNASKEEIKAIIEKLYKVKVIAVNTFINPGKPKYRHSKRGFQEGRTSSFKKAIVTLKEGEKIDFYSNI